MTRFIIALVLLTGVAGCGADGEPVKPKVTGQTSIGYSTSSGPHTGAALGICFGKRC
jgi:hypothetical protein